MSNQERDCWVSGTVSVLVRCWVIGWLIVSVSDDWAGSVSKSKYSTRVLGSWSSHVRQKRKEYYCITDKAFWVVTQRDCHMTEHLQERH